MGAKLTRFVAHGGAMAGDDAQYEFKSVATVRGAEARTTAKWQRDGWELVAQDPQLLRTKMTFRRVKPKRPWLILAAPVGALLILGSIVGVMAFLERSGSATTESAASPAMTVAAPSWQPTQPAPPASPERPARTAPASPHESTQTVPAFLGLWTTADGKKSIRCIADNGVQEVTFTLPARSPITKELNSILHALDGRAPLTVLKVKVVDHASYPKIDEADYFRTLYLQTPAGEIALDRRENDAWFVLDDTGLGGIASHAGTKKLRDRARALQGRINDDDLDGIQYLVTVKPLAQIYSARAEFRSMGHDCTVG